MNIFKNIKLFFYYWNYRFNGFSPSWSKFLAANEVKEPIGGCDDCDNCRVCHVDCYE